MSNMHIANLSSIHEKLLMFSRPQSKIILPIGSGRRSAILNLIKLKFFMVYPYLKLHILFNSNELSIWSGSPDITHLTKIMANNRPFCPP